MSKGSRDKQESCFSFILYQIAHLFNMMTVFVIAGVIAFYFMVDAFRSYHIEEVKQWTVQEKNCLDSKGNMVREWGTWICSHEVR